MIISDIETNGLLDSVTKFHCACIYDYKTDEYKEYRPHQFKEYINDLEKEIKDNGLLVFHNGSNYDIPAIRKLAKHLLNYNFEVPKECVVDTLVLSRLIYPNILDIDYATVRSGKIKTPKFTKSLYGSHSLKAWGFRVGEHKGEYVDLYKEELAQKGIAYKFGMEWESFSESMMEYNVQDVVVTKKVLETFFKHKYYTPKYTDLKTITRDTFWDSSLYCFKLEHNVAWLMAKQERNGYPIHKKGLEKLYAEATARRAELLLELVDTFGSWYEPRKTLSNSSYFLHPKTNKPLTKFPKVVYSKTNTKGYTKGQPYTPIKHITFNPSSRQHILRVLTEAGWVPTEFTEKGTPKVDEEVLEHVKLPDARAQNCINLIKEYLALQKLIGQVGEGKNAWLKLIREDGRIHGSVNPNGAVTGRATHSNPNLAQVPSGSHQFGHVCRECFGAGHLILNGVKDPWVQVGTDAKGLELRCLGHFLAPYDNGEYAETVVNGDIHTKNQIAAGLPTRGNAKTFIYGFLYGAGAARIGQIINGCAKVGKMLIEKFLENTPALLKLREAVQKALVESSRWEGKKQVVKWRRKFIIGLDKRQIHLRSPHAAVNSILQGAGAIICKYWIVKTVELLEERGYKHGWDGDFALMAWVHDEMQFAARTYLIAKDIEECSQVAMRDAQKFFKFQCVLDTDSIIGYDWAKCH